MTRPGVKKSYQHGRRLTDEVVRHRFGSGGTTLLLTGSKGSGKTTLLLTLAQCVQSPDPEHRDVILPETVVWRGRDADYWNWFPPERVCILINKDDYDNVIFKDDLLREIPRSKLPPIYKYSDVHSLYRQLRIGKINVVYEPSNYEMKKEIVNIIRKRGLEGDNLFPTAVVDPCIMWFEFWHYLVHQKNANFMTIIIDEADELIPGGGAAGMRWHLNLFAKDVMKDLRRRQISLFLACHAYSDLDGRVLSKLQYKIYLRGSVTMSTSLIKRHAPIQLEMGTYYIERDAWGMAEFGKLPEKSIVLTYIKGDEKFQPATPEPTYEHPPEQIGDVPSPIPAQYTTITNESIVRGGK